MITERSIVRAVSKLNLLTKSGELEWSPKKVSQDWYVDDTFAKTINPVYEATQEGKKLVLFKYTSRHYTDEDVYNVSTYISLGILDDAGNLSWEFPMDRSINDLYETVRYKAADIEGFLGKLAAGFPEGEPRF